MHRDTMMRAGGPLLCQSFAAIISCFNIMHSPMSQGAVHNSWKLKMSQFFHGLHTHQTLHPLNIFWEALGQRVGQNVPGPPIEKDWDNIPQAINSVINSMRRRCRTAWSKWLLDTDIFQRYLWPTDAFLYSQSCEVHRLGPNEFI